MASMAAEEDGDVFEITDFTTASEWERFISQLEEVLHEWKLANRDPLPNVPKGKFTQGPWEEKNEEILFADFKFIITYTRLKSEPCDPADESRNSREREADDDFHEDEHKSPTVINDIISMENDFPSRAHCLCRWYGLQEFLVIQPAPNFGIIDSESRAKILESSAAVALADSGCHVPTFIQLQQKWRKLYNGVAVMPGANVSFEMSHLKKLPSKYLHLDGLLNMFKGKLGCEYVSMPPVSVSVRFTYVLEDWIHCPWPQLPPDFSSFGDGEVGCSDLDILPFGACEDPVSELHLSCTWPYLSADMIVETSGYTDLDPLQAPQWSVRIQMTEDPQCLLGQYLRAFSELCSRTETTDEILGRLATDGTDPSDKEGGDDITNALQRLTEPSLPYHIPSLGSVVSRATTRLKIKPEEAPVPPNSLNQILKHLFPDATGLGAGPAQKGKGQNQPSREHTPLEETPPQGSPERLEEVFNEALKQLKSSPPDSLTYRLAVSLAIINFNHGGLRAIAHLWQEFILEMRYRWENSVLIPDVGATTNSSSSSKPPSSSSPSSPSNPFSSTSSVPAPNLGSCILHQKLQMLNCCIERKVKREAAGYGHEDTVLHEASSSSVFEASAATQDNDDASGDSPDVRKLSGSSEDDEDEFFECENEDEDGDEDDEEKRGGKGGGGGGGGDRKVSGGADSTASSSPKRLTGGKKKLVSEKSVDSSVSDASFKDATLMRAEGRLAPMKNARSLSTGEPLFIPVTQEPSPMTEDMLEEQAEVLAKLGSTAQGSQLRARMQSACLLSDMESFKAANPGCCLEDFVRWYSPRDYIQEEEEDEGMEVCASGGGPHDEEGSQRKEKLSRQVSAQGSEEATAKATAENDGDSADVTEGSEGESTKSEADCESPEECEPEAADGSVKKAARPSGSKTSCDGDSPATPSRQRRGRLSQRMQIPGNMWAEVWHSARHAPARRQKRLFDDTKEAEKVLHFLAGLRPAELVLHLLPMVLHAAALKLAEREDPDVPVLKTLTDQVVAKAVKVTRGPHPPELKRYEDVIRMIELAETVSSRAQSLKVTEETIPIIAKEEACERIPAEVKGASPPKEIEVSPKGLFRDRTFYILWFIFLLNGHGVQFVSSLYKVYGQTFISDDVFLAWVSAFAAFFNAGGRPMWGSLADRYSFKVAMTCLCCMFFVLILTLGVTGLAGRWMLFLVWVCLLFLAFSGNYSLMPIACVKSFGQKHYTKNYALIFTSQVITSPISAVLTSQLWSTIGWNGMFYMTAAFTFISFILSVAFQKKMPDGTNV